MPRIEANLLGSVAFFVDGRPVTSLPTRVSRAILVYLLYQKRPVSRDQLIDWFFRESGLKQGRTNLRATLSRIRKQTGDIIEADRETVRVRAGVEVVVDAQAFGRSMRNLKDSADIADLEATLALYRGDFLAGFFLRDAPEFEQWQVVEGERLRLLAIDGLQRLIRQLTNSAEYVRALDHVNHLLSVEPLLEQTHRDKMLLLARTGQRALALRHFNEMKALFEDELNVAPADTTIELFERLRKLTMPPPLRMPHVGRRFVGRAATIKALEQVLVAPTGRLITLAGMGGVGKTSLAQETARRLHANAPGAFLDGITFVDLAAARSEIDVALRVAEALGLFLSGGEPLTDQIANRLAPLETCLILDNFEELVESAAGFVSLLLRRCPGLTVLVTSRRHLELYDERVLEVSGLALSGGEADEASEAERLFVGRAAHQFVGYAPSADDRPAISRICSLLDGVPLALELAAGWAHRLEPEAIARQIQADIDFLATSLRDVPNRQRSLRAVFTHSWRMLPPEAQAVLALLSMFAGPFSLEAAQTVAQSTPETLDVLVSHSLLQLEEDGRYRLHPLVAQFSAEQRGVDDAPMQRFIAYYSDLIAGLDETGYWPDFQERMAVIRPAYDNVLAAWQRLLAMAATSGGATQEVLDAIDAMRRPLRSYALATNQIYAGHQLFKSAREQLAAAGWETSRSPEERLLFAKIACQDVDLGRITGDYERIIRVAERHLPTLEAANALADLYSGYLLLAEAYRFVGRPDDAAALVAMRESVAFRTERDELIGSVYLERAKTANEKSGDALEEYRVALSYLEPLQNPRMLAVAYDNMGAIYFRRGDLEAAVAHQRKALRYARSGELAFTGAIVLTNLALSLGILGRTVEALKLLDEGLETLIRLNYSQQVISTERTRGDVLATAGRWREAARAYRTALEKARRISTPRFQARVMARLPYLLCATGDTSAAHTVLRAMRNDQTINNIDRDWLSKAEEQLDEAPDGSSAIYESIEDVAEAFLLGRLPSLPQE